MRKMRRCRGPSTLWPRRISCGDMTRLFTLRLTRRSKECRGRLVRARARSYHPWSNCRSKTRKRDCSGGDFGAKRRSREASAQPVPCWNKNPSLGVEYQPGPKFHAGQNPPGRRQMWGVHFDIRAWAIERERLWLTLPVGVRIPVHLLCA
jgi:hypothetical protein